MVLGVAGEPLQLRELARPVPAGDEVLLRVHACAVCRTDLHILDGELDRPKLPLVLGHQAVGVVEALGPEARELRVGDRVGVPWLASACGTCARCREGHENLCPHARFTGYDVDGGYAEAMLARAPFTVPLPARYADAAAAPLLCGGLIGYRAWRMAPGAEVVGLYGFGSAAHMILQVARAHSQRVLAFTRPGDTAAQRFASELGADWAGGSGDTPPEPLDAALIFAPAGDLVPIALRDVRPGGVVVCAGIHMSDIPAFPYSLLWGERVLRSVANLTRADARDFFRDTADRPVETTIHRFPLEAANEALGALRAGSVQGTAVLELG
jgi:propanol-preferring alcohol dehydrogenase